MTDFTGRNARSTERVGYAVEITVDCHLRCRHVGSERLWRLGVIERRADDGNDQDDNGGNTGNGQDPTAKGPVTIAGAQKGGTVTVLTLTGLTDDDRPERDLLHRHQRRS